jgi:hypothetical protein
VTSRQSKKLIVSKYPRHNTNHSSTPFNPVHGEADRDEFVRVVDADAHATHADHKAGNVEQRLPETTLGLALTWKSSNLSCDSTFNLCPIR